MKKSLIIPILFSTIALTACSNQDSAAQNASSSTLTTQNLSTSTDSSTLYGKYSTIDEQTDYDESTATKINLTNQSVENDNGVSIDGQTVTITKGGTYVISGTLNNGQLKVAASNQDNVHLIFNNVSITNNSGPAVNVEQAEKVVITLANNTQNTVTDGNSYSLADGETEPDATIYSKDDLSFNGNGSLRVNANYQNGIRSKDDLVFVSGNYEVHAVNNAIKAKDSLSIKNGTYTLSTNEGDGLQANNSEDTTKGYIGIDGGTFTIDSGRDGVQAETNLSLQNANMTIKTNAGSKSTSVSSTESYKGLKASGNLLISSGTYDIDSADDSLHANGNVTITNGTITAKSGDDGIHADNTLSIEGGNVTIAESNEGIEASVINIKDGTTNITASDDGVNAGGGSDSTTTSAFGQDQFGGPGQKGMGGGDTADSSKVINITGGTLTVNAQGDGLDSNGNIKMSGGTVTVYGPTNGGNGSLDYNGTFSLTGGTLIASGASGMAQNVSSSDNQATIGINLSSTQSANTTLTLKDESGNEVASFTSPKTFQHVVFSASGITQGKTYTLYNGSTVVGSYTPSQSVSNFNQDGSASTNTGGMMGGGARR